LEVASRAMTSQEARRLFSTYASALAYLDVENGRGDHSIGSAFHIGEGVFVTARHVLEGQRIVACRSTEPVGIRAAELYPDLEPEKVAEWDSAISKMMGRTPLYKHYAEPLTIVEGPFFHDDARVDVAVFRVVGVHPATAVVPLGVHWDDWVYRETWNLDDALILGYPPIPLTNEPTLVAMRAEINTLVVLRTSPSVHFILSGPPRGGFSGGVALHEGGFALGVVTSSLTADGQSIELGFLAVLSIEPIRMLLEKTGLLPTCQKRGAE